MVLVALAIPAPSVAFGQNSGSVDPQATSRLLFFEESDKAPIVLTEDGTKHRPAHGEEVNQIGIYPLMYLFEGDELNLPEASKMVFLCYADSTRQTHFGPSKLLISPKGIVVLNQEATPPEVADIPGLPGPFEVETRMTERIAGVFVKGDLLVDIDLFGKGELFGADDILGCDPVPQPRNTAVPPGDVLFRWSDTPGGEKFKFAIWLVGANEKWSKPLDGECSELVISNLEPGNYYWQIGRPDNKQPNSYKFSVLTTDEWEFIAMALGNTNLDPSNLVSHLLEINELEKLAFAIAILEYYEMNNEVCLALKKYQALARLGR